MIDAHYPVLLAGYAVAPDAWLLLNRTRWSPWPVTPAPTLFAAAHVPSLLSSGTSLAESVAARARLGAPA